MTSHKVLISIITITKDNSIGLKKTLSSIQKIRKTYPKEIQSIIIDGSKKSNRNKNKIISRLFKSEYRMRKPKGISDAFNVGISLVDGEWIWFLNSGDVFIGDEFFEALFVVLSKTKSGIVACEINAENMRPKPPLWDQWPLINNWIAHPATFIRKKLLLKFGGFSLKYKIAMDGDLWFRLLGTGVLLDTISIPIVRFEERGLSQDKNKLAKEIVAIVNSNIGMLIKHYAGNLYVNTKNYFSYQLQSLGKYEK